MAAGRNWSQTGEEIAEDPRCKQRNTASGVAVSNDVIPVFNDFNVTKSSTPEVKKCKASVKKRTQSSGRQGDPGRGCGADVDAHYTTFHKMLSDKDRHYVFYDAAYETKYRTEDLVFIFWAPECAPLKSKMIYASSKDAIKKKSALIKNELQANSYKEIKDCCTLAEKLGGCAATSLEDKPL
ncbi:cofilin-1-like [Arvicola amphibius]|uniref:cofilin-1-like n=1 Tax=Arvicola amphibius TaxID=1047088 RepID=UPI0018E2AF26|nr:cofilin-1-like [Arvicola amphibius]